MNELSSAFTRIAKRLGYEDEAAYRRHVFETIHGIIVGETACAGCGTVVSEAHGDACSECHRPFPRRCSGWDDAATGARVPCDTFVQPTCTEDTWHPPAATCRMCMASARRESVVASLRRQGHESFVALLGLKFNHDWQHRSDAAEAVRSLARGERAAVYIHGNTGSGKSVLAAHGARWIAEHTGSSDVCWATEDELLNAAKTMYSDPAGKALLERAKQAHCLVIDELFSMGLKPWSDHCARQLAEILCRRFEGRRPTIITSNTPLTVAHDLTGRTLWDHVLDSRVTSRWAAVGVEVACKGPDLRTKEQ